MNNLLYFIDFINEQDGMASLSNTLGMNTVTTAQMFGHTSGTHNTVGSADKFDNEIRFIKKYKARRGKDVDVEEWEEEIFDELDKKENDKTRTETLHMKLLQKGKKKES